MKDRTCVVYGLCRSDNPNIRYVGQTFRPPEQRLAQHVRLAAKGRKSPLSSWIRKAHRESADVACIILDANARWNLSERVWIAKLRGEGSDLLNLTDGGQGSARVGARNTQAKLSADDINAIRESGLSNRTLARQYGVCDSQICVIRSGRAWSHIGLQGDAIALPSLRRFFDGIVITEEGQRLVNDYASGISMTAIARKYETTRPTVRRALLAVGARLRAGGIARRPIRINGRSYDSVQKAMKGEHLGYAALIAGIDG